MLVGFAKCARLPDIMRQWLLRKDVQATLHRRHRRDKVSVIGSADANRVNLLAHLVEHHSKITERGSFSNMRILLRVLVQTIRIDITQGHDVFALQAIVGHISDTTGTNHRDI